MSETRFYIGVFLVTASTLMLQLVQTRILSVVNWYHLAFFVISIAMFGLTAGAVWVYLRRDRFTEATLFSDLTYFTTAFAVTAALSIAVQTGLSPTVLRTATAMMIWAELAVTLAVPYFFSGVVVSLALTRSPFPIGRVYGVDLLGAAVGCVGVLLLLNSTDGPSVMLWVAATIASGAVFFQMAAATEGAAKRLPLSAVLRRPKAVLVVLAACAVLNGLSPYGLRPISVKGKFENPSRDLMFEEWNSFSRVAVFRDETTKPKMWGPSPVTPFENWAVEQRTMNIDGDASTKMYRYNGDPQKVGFLKYDVTNLAYFLPDRESAAIIGVGGGRDVLSASIFGIRDVTGVEINPVFIKLLKDEKGYSDFANISTLKGVNLVVDEARSWFARATRTFDVIQMSLIDTWAATGAGAFTLSENSLYTREAWSIFLRRLTPRGVFTVSRWYSTENVDETGRIVSLAVAALKDMGVAEPRRHIFLASSARIATILVSRSPLPPAYLDALKSAANRLEYRILIDPVSGATSPVLKKIMAARTHAELVDYTSNLDLDLTPPTDNRPFFFNQLPLNNPVRAIRMAIRTGGTSGGVAKGNLVATGTLAILFVISIGLVLATIVIPLRPAIRDVGRDLVAGGTAYFMLIGIGFMCIEIALLQRMSVFLGHPTYSLSVVLFSLILFTGVGSLCSDRLPLDARGKFIAWAALTGSYVFSLTVWLPDLLLQFDSAGILSRAALSMGAIAPAGLLMGFGFPTGMRLISAVDRTPTPWFWGINGAAGVLAAIIAVVTSIAFGINTTLIIGAVCYLLLVPVVLLTTFRWQVVPAAAPGE